MHNQSSFKKNILFALIIILFFLIGLWISNKPNGEKLYSKSKFYLGSIVEVQFYCDDEKSADHLMKVVFDEFERIDKKYSFYSSESYLAEVNSDTSSLIEVDDETFLIIKLCDSVYNITNGKFDASIGSLTKLWKKYIEGEDFSLLRVSYGKDEPEKPKLIPDEEEINYSKNSSGWINLRIVGENKIQKFKKFSLNFDAIIQGYAADRAIEILRSNGIEKALVNASGEIRVIGNDWRIGIKHPRNLNQLIEKVKLSNYSIATSGDYEKFIEVDGRRYHHIIDPETGFPSTKNMSVTIIAKDCALADALATGFFSLEPEEIICIADSLDDVYVFVVDSRNQIHKSRNFDKFLWRK